MFVVENSILARELGLIIDIQFMLQHKHIQPNLENLFAYTLLGSFHMQKTPYKYNSVTSPMNIKIFWQSQKYVK